jgi:hypothetical protein
MAQMSDASWDDQIEAAHKKLVEDQSPEERARLDRLRRLRDNNMSVDGLWRELNTWHGEAAQSTVDALLYELARHGIAQLKEPNCQRRLAEVSASQLRKIIATLIRLQRRHPNTITDKLIITLDAMVRP